MIKNYPWEPWQEFRDNYCYTLEVSDVLSANVDGIQGLMNYYYGQRKSYMSRREAISLFSRDS